MIRRWAPAKPGRKTASSPVKQDVRSSTPFPISEVTTPHSGKIGICPCPGRKFPPALGIVSQQSLTRDLLAIRAFPATALITLMEMGELDWAGPTLPELREACAAQGMQHIYLPIVDCEIPDPHWERRWASHGPELHTLLQSGHNIVFHCRGGRGRAGLAVTRMLIETGEAPALAIARVRAERSGAIETKAQEDYLLQLRP